MANGVALADPRRCLGRVAGLEVGAKVRLLVGVLLAVFPHGLAQALPPKSIEDAVIPLDDSSGVAQGFKVRMTLVAESQASPYDPPLVTRMPLSVVHSVRDNEVRESRGSAVEAP